MKRDIADIRLSSLCAIDDGSQYQKTARLVKKGGVLKIENDATRFCAEKTMAIQGIGGSPDENMTIAIENINTGNMDIITVDPELSPLDPKTLAIEHGAHGIQYDPRTAAMTYYSLNKMGFAGKDVKLIVGMPVGPFFSGQGGNVNNDIYQKKAKSLAEVSLSTNVSPQGDILENDPSKIASISSLWIYPEGCGAYYDAVYDCNGNSTTSFDSNVLVIDIGSYTTDVVVMLPSGRIDRRYQTTSGQASLPDGGSYATYRQLKDDLASHGYSGATGFRPEQVEHWVMSGQCKIAGKKVENFQEILAITLDKMRSKLTSHVSTLVGESIDTFDTILLAGGGADLLKDTLSKIHGNVVMGENPRFANVNGWLKFALANEFTPEKGYQIIDDLSEKEE